MQKYRKEKSLLTTTIKSSIVVFVFFILLSQISNLKSNEVFAQLSIPLQVAPARQEITVDKGTPRIIDDITQASPRFSAASWITLPYDRMSISPNDKVEIQAKMNVPADARPGGRYVAIYFEPTGSFPTSVDSPREAGAGVQPRIAGLVYIRVNGPVTEKAIISRLFAPSFVEYGPVDVEADLLNRGDYHIRPRGSITLTNIVGGTVEQQKLEEVNIFPDASRTYFNTLGRKWMFGKYTILISASYGDTGQIVQRSTSFWVFPWKVVAAIILALLILIFVFKQAYTNLIRRDSQLEKQLKKEHEEVEKLREELKEK